MIYLKIVRGFTVELALLNMCSLYHSHVE